MAVRLYLIILCGLCLRGNEAANTVRTLNSKLQVEIGLREVLWWGHPRPRCFPHLTCDAKARYRTATGVCNNLRHPEWGSADWPFDRLVPPVYNDRVWMPRTYGVGKDELPSPRIISSHVHNADPVDSANSDTLTNLFPVWGQYVDHDLTFTPQMSVAAGYGGQKVECCGDYENMHGSRKYDGGACFNICIPPNDKMKRRCMKFTRSLVAPPEKFCGKYFYNEQMNAATVFMDASEVYGSTESKVKELREFVGGRLLTFGHMLPEDGEGGCLKIAPTDYCFKAGDPRSNEHPGLSVVHTLFMRIHNQIAAELDIINPHWGDEILFQETKKIVAAIHQVITYKEWLPLLLGRDAMNYFELDLTIPYRYRRETNPTAFNSFAAAAFRYGHSQIPNAWTSGNDSIALGSMFMRPFLVLRDEAQGYDSILKGMLQDSSKMVDMHISSGLTNRLFESSEMPGLDLISLNIQRGRDHALPPYVVFKRKCMEITGVRPTYAPMALWKILMTYKAMNDVDLFTGSLAENPLPGARIGPTFTCIIGLFFHKIKWGDRFWYQTTEPHLGFTYEQQQQLYGMTYARVLCEASVVTSVQPFVFEQDSLDNQIIDCGRIPRINLEMWRDRP